MTTINQSVSSQEVYKELDIESSDYDSLEDMESDFEAALETIQNGDF